MDKKLGETTNLCVEIMNSKRQVMGKLALSRGTNLRLPFDIHVMLQTQLRQTAQVKFYLKILKIENDQTKQPKTILMDKTGVISVYF